MILEGTWLSGSRGGGTHRHQGRGVERRHKGRDEDRKVWVVSEGFFQVSRLRVGGMVSVRW